ncbi:hypothetical protein [Paraburkholderia hospita]|uniref:hypothetical protein n=1 Tax=Paraburkholderia hospita TaxID=169430 RepID=UPI0011781B1E|nr:hypothetical protein [Paraburkholderia hospita]
MSFFACGSFFDVDVVFAASPFGVLAFALASALRIRASSVAVWCFGLCAGIRVTHSCFERRRLVFWPLRWHPRYGV